MRILWIVLLGFAVNCAGPTSLILPASRSPTSKEESLQQTATERRITVAQAEEADSALNDENPPENLWESSQLREKAALQWASHCASCHGAKGQGENVPELSPAPRTFGGFGMSMGFLMGGNKMRGGIFRKIRNGTGQMPSFKDKLTNKEVWGLVYFIEHL